LPAIIIEIRAVNKKRSRLPSLNIMREQFHVDLLTYQLIIYIYRK